MYNFFHSLNNKLGSIKRKTAVIVIADSDREENIKNRKYRYKIKQKIF